ncbi:hypothetical protein Leryth_021534 [Lithospermum erythrorhizon]|uniref:U-box domain-containing protein n=1 Tax=Lithospermum erythrorhizon TaxID=34254 RepID=A0AAV3PVM7_LITER|nr:hypothetical protein Leryth_021534 [Lithospermum erythrorhizon]
MSSTALQNTIMDCLDGIQSRSETKQAKALQNLVSLTKVSPQNRNFVVQTNELIFTLFMVTKSSSSSPTIQNLALSILFNLSLNPNLKHPLATMENIMSLNSVILSPGSTESSKLSASLICSLAMLDKNKSKFGVAGTVEVLVKSVSEQCSSPAAHHLLSSLAELVQFHGNCTVAVRSGVVEVLLGVVESIDSDDLAGTSLAILCSIARFEQGLVALLSIHDEIIKKMLEVLKGRSMFSKEGAAEILLRLFDADEECLFEALRINEFLSVVADLSVRGSGRARQKAALLMNKMMEAGSKASNQHDQYL